MLIRGRRPEFRGLKPLRLQIASLAARRMPCRSNAVHRCLSQVDLSSTHAHEPAQRKETLETISKVFFWRRITRYDDRIV